MSIRIIHSEPRTNWPDEIIEGPVYVRIKWQGPVRLTEINSSHGGGVYLLLNKYNTILKAGQAEKFSRRAKQYLTDKYQKTIISRQPVRMYMGHVLMGRTSTSRVAPDNPLLVFNSVERAITRTLRRAGIALPLEKNFHRPQLVAGEIRIENLLPGKLHAKVSHAYTNPRNRRVYALPGSLSRTPGVLYLRQADQPQWADELDEIINEMV